MKIPCCTYRLQLNQEFSFNDARVLIPYLDRLGISDIYSSPIFKAREGSTHGYDVVNPLEINPEIGTRVEFDHLLEEVKNYELGWVQDIVPNHMAIDSGNEFLMDIFENGPSSPAYNYFDINWNHTYEGIKGKLLLPILGSVYADCLESSQIQLSYDGEGFWVNYYEHRFPLKIETYASILGHRLERLKTDLGSSHSGLIKLLGVLYIVKTIHTQQNYQERKGQVSFAKAMLHELYTGDVSIKEYIDENVKEFNGTAGEPQSFELLDKLHSEQYFKLSYWKVATEELNYRRFFTINDLISIRAEDEHVFTDSHALVIDLFSRGIFTGLRIDHIDGLYNPLEYLQRLRNQAPDLYIVTEKILAYSEEIRGSWPVQGTTGYDFLNMVCGIFCYRDNSKKFDKLYQKFTGITSSFDELLLDKKRLIIKRHMAGDIDNLALLIRSVSSRDRWGTDMTLYGLRNALIELIAAFPVYRTYINSGKISAEDSHWLELTFKNVKKINPQLTREIEFIERYLMLQFEPYASEQTKKEWIDVIMRFQQFSGPLMAKGFEDTLLYHYNRFIPLNDVGGFPERFGVETGKFHSFNAKRMSRTPHTLNATSTHDTKRGEDARMRLCVVSELFEEWKDIVTTCSKINKQYKRKVDNENFPDNNDEYFLYQTLIGSWPNQDEKYVEFIHRIKEYMLKAVREAKAHTGWIKPFMEYENQLLEFISNVLDKENNSEFFHTFEPFQKKTAWYGVFNSLSQLIIKCSAPGIPDFYQGTELWDLSMVDPDNRRDVDYAKREEILSEIRTLETTAYPAFIHQTLSNPQDGKIKFFTMYNMLKNRKEINRVYNCGDYSTITTNGERKRNIFAFSRKYENDILITAVPRLLTEVVSEKKLPLGREVWNDSCIELPDNFPKYYRNVLTEERVELKNGRLDIGDLFTLYPGAVLINQ
ncbi:Malto-oligosyl trehalose synthase [Chitinispirillum alkaliphilum]|nr:Malto-oligosyl trehalose synthase [Chitinispirillum alkaliphilum]